MPSPFGEKALGIHDTLVGGLGQTGALGVELGAGYLGKHAIARLGQAALSSGAGEAALGGGADDGLRLVAAVDRDAGPHRRALEARLDGERRTHRVERAVDETLHEPVHQRGRVGRAAGVAGTSVTNYMVPNVIEQTSRAYLLRTPEGKVWVLQVFTTDKDKTMSMETMDQLGSKLQLPEGWKFEVKMLDRDLSLQPRRVADGEAYIMRDNLGNTYQGCGFDAACSYLP